MWRLLRRLRYSLQRKRRRWARHLDRLELFVADVLYDRRHDRKARLLALSLHPLSLLFGQIVRCRLWLYRRHYFSSTTLGCPVIVVGNLTVGGTGKTPVTEVLARFLQAHGRRVAILSRGYKSRQESLLTRAWHWLSHQAPRAPKIVSDGKQLLLSAAEAGDEPRMLAQNLPGVCVLVDRNRVKAGQYAIRHLGADVLLLDDGLQYLPLKGHLYCTLWDKTQALEQQHLLPRGVLREPLEQLRRASCLLLSKSDGRCDEALNRRLRAYNAQAPMLECCHRPKFFIRHADGQRELLQWVEGKRIAILSGIARPESFEQFLRELGAHIAYHQRFSDHHPFGQDDLERFDRCVQLQAIDAILTTEKDSVRIRRDFPFCAPLHYLRIEIAILPNAQALEDVLFRFLPSLREPLES
ncbi:MAG: tetraacyldisaccharide 4'-kinase [Puniceicoccales bacterium]|jgi:tetraacyldisaccharide 4'-kinase|nr:tetraacyldisaccharide 4'-kinase [Puniceicoccales bacterium]